jgi:hypothetical protein
VPNVLEHRAPVYTLRRSGYCDGVLGEKITMPESGWDFSSVTSNYVVEGIHIRFRREDIGV